LACYKGLAEKDIHRIALTGDSAGGNLALGLASRIISAAVSANTVLVGVAVFSPVTDLTLSSPSYQTRADADPLFTRSQVAELVRSYLGVADPKNPLASPLHGRLAGMPPVRIHVGDDEVLLDDSRRYVERVVDAGIDAKLDVWMGMPHGFVGSIGRLKAAAQALDSVGVFLAGRLRARLPRKSGQNNRKRGKDAGRAACLASPCSSSPGCPSAPKNGAATMNATRYLPFVGRLFIGLPFMASGLSKVANYAGTIALINSSTLPLPPPLAYGGAIAVEVGCGLLIILGYQTRIVAAIFCLFCLATAVFFHLNFADPNQIFHFIKNMVMTGGLLQVVTYGAGALSIDNRRSKSHGQASGLVSAA